MESEKSELVTVEEYFTLLKKTEELSPKEIMQKKEFEDFIERCENNAEFISPATESVYAEYQRKLANLSVEETKTPQEIALLTEYQEKMEKSKEEENVYVKKLDKAGYASAIVILTMLLNIGFIVAMALLK